LDSEAEHALKILALYQTWLEDPTAKITVWLPMLSKVIPDAEEREEVQKCLFEKLNGSKSELRSAVKELGKLAKDVGIELEVVNNLKGEAIKVGEAPEDFEGCQWSLKWPGGRRPDIDEFLRHLQTDLEIETK